MPNLDVLRVRAWAEVRDLYDCSLARLVAVRWQLLHLVPVRGSWILAAAVYRRRWNSLQRLARKEGLSASIVQQRYSA